ncbi:MAG: D-tyrosyl-tRNA(Tyr) deacylase [delta proteobacterium MLS_D]|jgi:D-aminoacyl-tRNA deacylase|nr:MAG: D-tyrosyl-tRNA(Tyr) deacylase [delta proteobacterium MLS_D]
MRALIQRVDYAKVFVEGVLEGSAGAGFLVLLGVADTDDETSAELLAEKVVHIRIFEDDTGKMNRSILDVSGDMLIISQFTLLADTGRGRRPSFNVACEPVRAERLYRYFVDVVRGRGIETSTGSFGKMMKVELVNNGPVTILLDTDNYTGKNHDRH